MIPFNSKLKPQSQLVIVYILLTEQLLTRQRQQTWGQWGDEELSEERAVAEGEAEASQQKRRNLPLSFSSTFSSLKESRRDQAQVAPID